MLATEDASTFWNQFCAKLDILFIYQEKEEVKAKKDPEEGESDYEEEPPKKRFDFEAFESSQKFSGDINLCNCVKYCIFSQCLQELDTITKSFERFKVQNLIDNTNKAFDTTPAYLQEIKLNSTGKSSMKGAVRRNSIQIGLVYDKIDATLLNNLFKQYPNMFTTSVSQEKLIELRQNVEKQYSNLKILDLNGNPLVLVDGKDPTLQTEVPSLNMLDMNPVSSIDMNKLKSKTESEGPSTPGEIRLKTDSSFDLSISVLGGINGVKLTEETCSNLPNFDELETKYKSSRFWIQAEFLGETIKSDVKQWDTEFMKVEEIGKTDFKISLRRSLRLIQSKGFDGTGKSLSIYYDEATMDAIFSGMWIELYEEYPVIEEFQAETGEKLKRVVMNGAIPCIKTAMRGVVNVPTAQWILNPEFGPKDMIIHKKFYFYKPKYKTVPEFCYENFMVTFSHSDYEAVDVYVASKREKMAKEEEELKEKAAAEAKVVDPKKDPKKDKVVKKPDDKNVIVVEVVDPEGIPYSKDYKLIEKTYNQSMVDPNEGEFIVPGKVEGYQSKKNKENKNQKEMSAEERIKKKQKAIFKDYDVILSLKSWITVKLALNQPEVVAPVAAPVVEQKAPDKKPGKK